MSLVSQTPGDHLRTIQKNKWAVFKTRNVVPSKTAWFIVFRDAFPIYFTDSGNPPYQPTTMGQHYDTNGSYPTNQRPLVPPGRAARASCQSRVAATRRHTRCSSTGPGQFRARRQPWEWKQMDMEKLGGNFGNICVCIYIYICAM